MFFFYLLTVALARGESVRETYQFNSLSNNAALHRYSFGLTPSQSRAIYDLTEGEVDLRFHYYRDHFVQSILNILSPLGFRGLIHPNVPPPFYSSNDLDPDLDDQWWIEQLQVEPAWSMATGKGITIADCDAGYYTNESDLAANLVINHRYDTADQDDPLNVSDGSWMHHGTAVVALMAATKDGAGTNGIAYDARVVPLQNFNYNGQDDIDKEEATARCILRAITVPGVNVIVLENQTATGSSETFSGTREAVKLALKAGIVVVSAAGNNNTELTAEAAQDTDSIIVGALTREGQKASYSNFGGRVSISAFGEQLHTLFGPDGKMGEFGGTSGATPQVAATVALMLEANDQLTPLQIKAILISTRVESPQTQAVGGRLNTLAAVTTAQKTIPDRSGHSVELASKVRDILYVP